MVHRRMIPVYLVLAYLCVTPTHGFCINGRHFPRRKVVLPSVRFLAKPKSKASSAPAKGFGSSSASSSSSAPKPNVRSLASGHAGTGTKVLRKAANLFDEIRKAQGAAACRDVYVRAPANSATTYWFAGKVATRNNATPQQAAVAQKRLILEYAKSELRPQNLGGAFAKDLELWLAPGDSEMDVVQNKVTLEKVTGSASDLLTDFDPDNVGFNPEIYVGDEKVEGGLRVQRDEEGRPIKPVFDVNA